MVSFLYCDSISHSNVFREIVGDKISPTGGPVKRVKQEILVEFILTLSPWGHLSSASLISLWFIVFILEIYLIRVCWNQAYRRWDLMGILLEGNLPLPQPFHVLSKNGELFLWKHSGFCKYSCCLPMLYLCFRFNNLSNVER